jgi:hypothetical protein
MNSDAKRDREQQYAWNWFSYHAGQRLTAFNFFLVIFGALLVGYVQAATHHLGLLGGVLGFLGLLVSLAFWAMDVRNSELVYCGRAALDALEKSLDIHPRADDQNRAWLGSALCVREGDRAEVRKTPSEADGEDPTDNCRLYRLVRGKPRREHVFTHSFWLRAVLLFVGVASVWGGCWAGVGFPR